MVDARVKAKKLADTLGVKLVAVVSYNEYEGGAPDYYSMRMGAEGGGGPSYVSGGSKDVTVNVMKTCQKKTAHLI